jgi:large subunit ribosomal protein L9
MANMKLLLNESIKNVGKVGDVVEVSAGFARNCLLPKGLAVEPTPANMKRIEARRKEIERQERERREQQETLIKQLKGKANEQGHLFGSVSATDIAKALQSQGFNINPDDVNLPGKLDRIEKYTVKIRFAQDLETDVKVWVAPDAESKALIDAASKAKAAEPPAPSNYESLRK